MIDVVALGELLIDFAQKSKDENGYPTLAANAGGAPVNFLTTLSKYGYKTAFLGKVGNDNFGHMLVDTLSNIGINTNGIIKDDNVFTTMAFVTFKQNGDRMFSFARKPGADTCLEKKEIDFSIIQKSKIFHFGTLSLTNEPSRSATIEAVKYAQSNKKTITFDPNLRLSLWQSEQEAKNQIIWGLKQADIVKISDNEVEFLWNCDEKIGAERLLNEFNIKLAMITLGEKGCYIANKNHNVYMKCPKVNPIDTTGAGDIFGGSAISQILKIKKNICDLNKEDLTKISQFACIASSLSTEKNGGIPSIPPLEKVNQYIKNSLLEIPET